MSSDDPHADPAAVDVAEPDLTEHAEMLAALFRLDPVGFWSVVRASPAGLKEELVRLLTGPPWFTRIELTDGKQPSEEDV